jgi:hypothetical protein
MNEVGPLKGQRYVMLPGARVRFKAIYGVAMHARILVDFAW